ncbi:MAG: hypothetical protein IPN85_02220 [Flavobacteriales bacterium]|nr:hypothetical protein [Flavobacteriales bacterium]MBK9287284.1 hypothetical protein [Flavobacteriales bacterium]MBL0034345.1 hypothetical protein [Flavobacteriales bacterium]
MNKYSFSLAIVLSQAVPLRSSAQGWEVFDMVSAGLPSNAVRAIAIAPNGDAWVGTEYGLCRYDGSLWQVFQTGSSGVPDNDIRALAVDDTGTVWIGTLSGLARYDDGTWATFTSGNSGLPENYVRSLEVAPEGGLWVGTVGGLAWFDGQSTWREYNDTPSSYNGLQLPGTNIAALKARADGLLCIGTVNAGFTYLTDSTVTVYTTFANGLPDNTTLGVALDSDGSRWLACPAGALLSHAGDFIGGAWYQYSTLNSMMASNALTSIVIDGGDRKFLGNQISGLTLFQGFSSFTTFTSANSDLPGDEIMSLALDGAGRVWVGTSNGGAARFSYAVGIDDVAAPVPQIIVTNPVGDVLALEVPPTLANGEMNIRDASGRIVSSGRFEQGRNLVPVERLAPGIYLLETLRPSVGSQRFVKL